MDNTAIISTLLEQVDTEMLEREVRRRKGQEMIQQIEPMSEREIQKEKYKQQLKQKMYFTETNF